MFYFNYAMHLPWILPKIDNFISTNTCCFINQIIFTMHKIQSNKIFLNINLQYFVFCPKRQQLTTSIYCGVRNVVWNLNLAARGLSDGISQAFCWCNRYHRSWPFLECRPSKLYFKILWKRLTLLLPDSNFKRRCVRHNILTSSIVDVLGQEKALFVLATTLVQYMPTIWTFPFFCILQN
jgi:hypothetical protein